MNATVLGCGRWASFLAWYLDKAGSAVTMWGRPGSESLEKLRAERRNDYLELPQSVILTDDLEGAVNSGEIIFIAISAQHLRELCHNHRVIAQKPVILCMKGVEKDTGLRLTQVVQQELGADFPLAVWVGPGHPQDFVRGIPNCMVIDSGDPDFSRKLAEILTTPLIRFYYGEDLIGTEIGAAAKNVVGIAAGMLDGLGFSSLKGVLMARGAREVSRLVGAMGGKEITVYGLCHLGDYEATLFSPHGHNRKFGESIITGKAYDKLAEGVSTAWSMMKLSALYGVEMPICAAVTATLGGSVDPKTALTDLFSRDSKNEFYS